MLSSKNTLLYYAIIKDFNYIDFYCLISGSNSGIDCDINDIDIRVGRPMTLCRARIGNPYFAITLISLVTHVDRKSDHIQYSNAALSSVTQIIYSQTVFCYH